MFRSIGFLAAIAACVFICFTRGARAATYTEVGGTGDLPATAQDVGPGINRIVGELLATLQFTDVEVDMYKVTFASGGLFTFETRSSTSAPAGGTLSDPNLFLFNSAGNPLAGDDDDIGGVIGAGGGLLDSAFQLNLAAGTYYVAIGANNTFGLDAALAQIVSNDTGVQNAAGVIAAWGTPEGDGGTYQILISQATVPEPSSLALAGIAATGLCTLRRRRR